MAPGFGAVGEKLRRDVQFFAVADNTVTDPPDRRPAEEK
jgi:hypothetical protein